MSVLSFLSSLAIKGAVQADELYAVGNDVEATIGLLRQHFSHSTKRLIQALERSNDRAWRSVELALAGTAWWESWKAALSSAEERAVAGAVRAFLEAYPFDGVDDHGPNFRARALAQLQAARKAGLLTRGPLDPDELARRVGDLIHFRADDTPTITGEHQVLGKISALLRQNGYEALAVFLEHRPASAPPVLLTAVRYFFRRELEEDEKLFQDLAIARLEGMEKGLREGFAGLAKAMEELGERLRVQLADAQAVLAQTRGDVLDIETELARHGHQIEQLGQAVQKMLVQHQLDRRELSSADSLSVSDEAEQLLVRDLVRRYRALPEGERRRMPALLNAVGKLEVVVGDFKAAQEDFSALAELLPKDTARAEVAHNAYRAALELRAWDGALAWLKEAVALDSGRFAPFPAEKFEPVRILGAGGIGVAFLCRNRQSGSRVVIKTLRREGLDRELREVAREARTLETLNHPAIIRVRDYDARNSEPFLVMDYFRGQNLADYVEHNGPLPLAELLPLAKLIADGLQHVHDRGILHRDIKPANVLVHRSGSRWDVKLIDFGLVLRAGSVASNLKASLDRTVATNSVAGIQMYAAPEQMGKLMGDSVGPWSDVYGFGKTFCFALFGTSQATHRHWKQIPPDLANLLHRCISALPSQRPQDFGQVLANLNHLHTLASPSEPPVAHVPVLQEVDLAPRSEPRKREVSTGFSRIVSPLDPIGRDRPLCPGQDYLFWLEVGPPVAGAIDVEPAELDVRALPPNTVLQVVLFGFPGEIECLSTKAQLVLGLDGSVQVARQPSELAAEVSAELRERRLFFPVRTPDREGDFKLRCHIYYGAVLLQSRVIEAAVRSAAVPLPRALSARIDYVRSPSLAPAAIARVEPVEISVLLNDNGHGTHSLRFFGCEQWAADAHFEGDELKQLIDLVRSTLHEVSWGSRGPWHDHLTYKYPNGRGEREQLRADLSRLAKAGFRLYAAIRDRLSGDLSPAQLREKLRSSIRIQVAHHESARLYLPASLVYDSPIDTAQSSFTLCPEFVTALDKHVQLHATTCFTEGCPNAGKLGVVCPSGFWGFRHVLGLPLSVGRGPDPDPEIPTGPRGRMFLAAVSLELDHASPLEHIRELGFADGWNYRVSESRDEAVELFRTAAPHLVYLYCHGGFDVNGIVYVSLGRTDQAAPEANRITFDNLTAYEIDWRRSSPLVFLNGCRTAAPRPDRVMDLISDFVRVARASGVIGTEITIFESLACRFAPACLRPFLRGVRLGEAVRQARLEVLAAENPLGLIYVPYAPHDLRFAKLAMPPVSQPDVT